MTKNIILATIILTMIFVTACSGPTGPQGVVDETTGYQGGILAGTESLYIDFNQADYEKALAEKKVVVLSFYATWCPSCKAEQKHVTAAFDELSNEDIIGFRVNFKDSDTDEFEQALAKEYNIIAQHTKVILQDGEEMLKALEAWDKDRLVSQATRFA